MPDQHSPGLRLLAVLPLSPRARLAWCAVWLAFLAYPIADLAGHASSIGRTGAGSAALLVFVGLYLRTMWLAIGSSRWIEGGTPPWWLAAFVAYTLVVVGLFGPAWGGIIIYLGVAAGSTLSGSPLLAVMGAIDVATLGIGLAQHAGGSDIAFVCFLGSALALSMLGIRRLVVMVVELEAARDEVARLTAEEERLRIARDLHDVVGHSLSAIALKAQVARRLLHHAPVQAVGALDDIEAVAQRLLGEVRELVSGYRPRLLADELASAEELLDAAGVQLTCEVAPMTLDPSQESVLAWAVREGVTNVIRHARARTCRLTLSGSAGRVSLVLLDDGAGDAGGERRSVGSGLRGLGERAAAAGGEVRAGPRPEGGFELVVELSAAAPAELSPGPA